MGPKWSQNGLQKWPARLKSAREHPTDAQEGPQAALGSILDRFCFDFVWFLMHFWFQNASKLHECNYVATLLRKKVIEKSNRNHIKISNRKK